MDAPYQGEPENTRSGRGEKVFSKTACGGRELGYVEPPMRTGAPFFLSKNGSRADDSNYCVHVGPFYFGR
jgi:hypothetical protein